MDPKEFLSVVFKPIWTWIIGGIFAILGVLVFFIPDLGSILNWPSLSQNVPGYFWISIAFFIWALGIAWEAARRIVKEPPELRELARLRKEGVKLRNIALTLDNPMEVDQFIELHDEWYQHMISVVEKISPAMAAELEILDTFPATKRPNDVNPEHSKYSGIMTERLKRLNDFITDFTLAYHKK